MSEQKIMEIGLKIWKGKKYLEAIIKALTALDMFKDPEYKIVVTFQPVEDGHIFQMSPLPYNEALDMITRLSKEEWIPETT